MGDLAQLLQQFGGGGGGGMAAAANIPIMDTAETVHISSMALMKMLLVQLDY